MFISDCIYDLDDVFKEIYPMETYDRVKALNMMQKDLERYHIPGINDDKIKNSDKSFIIVRNDMESHINTVYFVEVDNDFQDFIRKKIYYLDIGDIFRLPFNNKIVRVVDTENPNKGEINLTYQDREGIISFKTFDENTEVSHYYKFSGTFLLEGRNMFGL